MGNRQTFVVRSRRFHDHSRAEMEYGARLEVLERREASLVMAMVLRSIRLQRGADGDGSASREMNWREALVYEAIER